MPAAESAKSTNRLLFLTDLNSTVDSAHDEVELLDILRTEAARNVFTSIVGIGMVSEWLTVWRHAETWVRVFSSSRTMLGRVE